MSAANVEEKFGGSASAPPLNPSFPSFQAPISVTWVDRVKREPLAFGFLALTVGALSLGLRSLHNNDKRQSQLMMRARVFFQFCTVTALLGNIYYRSSQEAELKTRNSLLMTTNTPANNLFTEFIRDDTRLSDLAAVTAISLSTRTRDNTNTTTTTAATPPSVLR